MSTFNRKSTNRDGNASKTSMNASSAVIKRLGSSMSVKSNKGFFKNHSTTFSVKHSVKKELQTDTYSKFRLKEIVEKREIINRISDWAGGKEQAIEWYRAKPLPSFGGLTAEKLVKDGKASAVHSFLDRIEIGGFA